MHHPADRFIKFADFRWAAHGPLSPVCSGPSRPQEGEQQFSRYAIPACSVSAALRSLKWHGVSNDCAAKPVSLCAGQGWSRRCLLSCSGAKAAAPAILSSAVLLIGGERMPCRGCLAACQPLFDLP